MHESVQAFQQATQRERHDVQGIIEHLQRAKAEGLPVLHEREMDAKVARLLKNVEGYEQVVADYEETVASGDTSSAAYQLAMIQILQAERQALANAHAEIQRLHGEIHRLQSEVLDRDDGPPDAS